MAVSKVRSRLPVAGGPRRMQEPLQCQQRAPGAWRLALERVMKTIGGNEAQERRNEQAASLAMLPYVQVQLQQQAPQTASIVHQLVLRLSAMLSILRRCSSSGLSAARGAGPSSTHAEHQHHGGSVGRPQGTPHQARAPPCGFLPNVSVSLPAAASHCAEVGALRSASMGSSHWLRARRAQDGIFGGIFGGFPRRVRWHPCAPCSGELLPQHSLEHALNLDLQRTPHGAHCQVAGGEGALRAGGEAVQRRFPHVLLRCLTTQQVRMLMPWRCHTCCRVCPGRTIARRRETCPTPGMSARRHGP